MNHHPRMLVFIPGILTWPGDARDWNREAVRWTHIHTRLHADDVEYFTTPLTRPFREYDRAQKFAAVVNAYSKAGYRISCIGHSNGCDVILDGLRLIGWPRVESLHMVCAACESDFEKNGLNQALFRERVDQVYVYRGAKDLALRLADTILGKLLGYGTLGLTGPINTRPITNKRIHEQVWKTYGHSDCWNSENFDQTMKLLTV